MSATTHYEPCPNCHGRHYIGRGEEPCQACDGAGGWAICEVCDLPVEDCECPEPVPEIPPCPFCGQMPIRFKGETTVECTTDGCAIFGVRVEVVKWGVRKQGKDGV
jgi:hypothetical protein